MAKKKVSSAKRKGKKGGGEKPWEARKRILCGRRPDYSLSDGFVAEIVKDHDEAARLGDEERCKRLRTLLVDRRFKNVLWDVADEDGKLYDGLKSSVSVAVLMDIREKLENLADVMKRVVKKRSARQTKKAA